jgi:NAD(P)-dependent dehydrogenase (short-subunit alcohol dehydrogenase family)
MSNINSPVWFITGANRGLGLEIAKAGLALGYRVVATARNTQSINQELGPDSDHLLSLSLDVTNASSIEAAVNHAKETFLRIDVLVNNAGYGQMGAFEEVTPEAVERQFSTNVFGLMDVTRTILPIMRRNGKGHIFNVSSAAGLKGGNRYSVYAASKFAVTGFSESLAEELRMFGIKVTVIEPGYFRTDFLDSSSIAHGTKAIEDYQAKSEKFRSNIANANQLQSGDPKKLARALMIIEASESPPIHFLAGRDAMDWLISKNQLMNDDISIWHELSVNTDFNLESP